MEVVNKLKMYLMLKIYFDWNIIILKRKRERKKNRYSKREKEKERERWFNFV